jgi:DNA-binding SARP family transcriptional activator
LKPVTFVAKGADTTLDFRLLGPLEVFDGERAVVIGSGKRRSLLALLLLHGNEVVSADRLIDGLWGESPPPTAAKGLQVYVSQLRKELHNGADRDGDVLVTRPTATCCRSVPTMSTCSGSRGP